MDDVTLQSLITVLWKGGTVQIFRNNLKESKSIQEEIKSRLKSGNFSYHSVLNLLSSSVLSKHVRIKIQRNIILPVLLYGCETWSLTLREEPRLRVSENKALRIFGPKRDEVTRDWRKLHNGELNNLYCSSNIVRVIKSRMRWAWHVARMGRGAYRVLVGNLRERGHLEGRGVDVTIILRWIFSKLDRGHGLDWSGSG